MRLVHSVVMPILPQAEEKQRAREYAQVICERSCAYAHVQAYMHVRSHTTYISIYIYLSVSSYPVLLSPHIFAYLSVF